MKGNVIDLAVGVVIGAAFGKIVASLVGRHHHAAARARSSAASTSRTSPCTIGTDADGKPVLLKYGVFIQTVFEFLIIALALFVVIKGINRLKRPPPPSAPPPGRRPRPRQLLQEIRDLLARRNLYLNESIGRRIRAPDYRQQPLQHARTHRA